MSTYYPQPRTASGLNITAVVSIVTAALGMAIVPVILGHVSLAQIRRTGESGTALAIIGLVLGYLEIAAYVVGVLILLGVVGVGFWAAS